MLTKTPLVPILSTTFNNQEVNSVSAKELHKALELKKDFSTWIKKQIERAELVKEVDYIKLTQKGELSKTGQTQIDYILTLDSAKHIAMMSQSKKAKEVRNYFIETERNYIALLKEKALTAQPSAPTVTLTTSLTDELFRLNEYLFNKKVISAKLTPNEIRVLSALIKLQESRGDKYILATNALIAKEASISGKSVEKNIGQLEEAKAITRLHKRNQEGRQERRIFISKELLAELNITKESQPTQNLPVEVETSYFKEYDLALAVFLAYDEGRVEVGDDILPNKALCHLYNTHPLKQAELLLNQIPTKVKSQLEAVKAIRAKSGKPYMAMLPLDEALKRLGLFEYKATFQKTALLNPPEAKDKKIALTMEEFEQLVEAKVKKVLSSQSLAKSNEDDDELDFPPTTKEEKILNLKFAIENAKRFMVIDPQHTEQYKQNIYNAHLHLAILESA